MARRLTLTIATIGLIAVVLWPKPAAAQFATGTMNVHAFPPAGKTLTGSRVTVVRLATGFSLATMFGAGTGPFAMTNLPVANDYGVQVVSSTTTPGEVCSGLTGGIPIAMNQTTITFVTLACGQASATAVPALGRHAALLVLSLALLGAIALRRRARSA